MTTQTDTGAGVKIETKEIPVTAIEPNPWQPRTVFKMEEMKQLSASIKTKGLIHPISVRPHPMDPGRYQIIAGERRWRATKMADLKTIRCEIREISNEDMEDLAGIENMGRDDMNPIDEAHFVKRLLDRGKSFQQIAEAVGRSKSSLEEEQNLLRLPKEIQKEVITGSLKKKIAIEIGKLATNLHFPAFKAAAGRTDESALNRIRIIEMASKEQVLFTLQEESNPQRDECARMIDQFIFTSGRLLTYYGEQREAFLSAAADRRIFPKELDLLIKSLKKIRQEVGLVITYRTTKQEEQENDS